MKRILAPIGLMQINGEFRRRAVEKTPLGDEGRGRVPEGVRHCHLQGLGGALVHLRAFLTEGLISGAGLTMVGKDETSVRTIIVVVIHIPRLRRVLLKISMVRRDFCHFHDSSGVFVAERGRWRLLHRHSPTLFRAVRRFLQLQQRRAAGRKLAADALSRPIPVQAPPNC